MSEYSVNNSLVSEAKSLLNGIRTHQKSSADKLSGLSKQVEDLKIAQRKLSEAYTKNAPEYHGSDNVLRHYIRKDGTLRLHS